MTPPPEIENSAPAAQSLLDRLVSWGASSQMQYLGDLKNLEPLLAVVSLVVGVVVLLFGWRLFKVWVIVNAAIVGALLGERLCMMIQRPDLQLWIVLAAAALLALLAWPLMKFAISLLGGMAGAFLGFHVWRYVITMMNRPDLLQYEWVGALVGLVVLGLLAFLIFRFVVIVTTSMQGSLLMVSGILALCLKWPALESVLDQPLRQSPHLLAFLVTLPAVVGVIYQLCANKPAPEQPQAE